jgi:hypothetical protein
MEPTNLTAERQILLLNLVSKTLSKSKNEYVDFLLADLYKNPILGDFNNIKIILERLKKNLQGFDYEIITQGKITSVLDYDLKNLPQFPYKIRVIIENQTKLKNKIVELSKKIILEKNSHTFTLNKKNELSLDGSKIKPYKMEADGNRLKVLKFLAKEKKFIKTKDLSTRTGIDTKILRKTIGEIRSQVSKKLQVLPESIIKNQLGLGYKVDNVKLI